MFRKNCAWPTLSCAMQAAFRLSWPNAKNLTACGSAEACENEQERVRQMQKLRYMIMQAQMRYQRPIHVEENDPYYSRLLERIGRLKR